MNTRKIIGYGFLAVVLTLAFAALSLTGCESPTDPAHVHQWGEWDITAATCIATGSQTRTCALDATHTQTETIPIDLVDGHDWGEWEGTVTCTEAGTGTRVCSLSAEHTEERDDLQPLGHNYQNWTTTTPSTCTTAGEEKGTCTHDNTHTTTRAVAINPDAHDYQIASGTAPTCTEDGNGVEICSYNQEHIISGVLPKLGHDYQNYTETTAPTCSAVGKEEAPCTRDSSHEKSVRDIPIDHNAHDYQNYAQTTAPTCSAKGIDTGTCTYNNTHKDPREGADINPNAHDYNYVQTTAPTCSAKGIDTGTCTYNNAHTTTREGAAIVSTAHDWGEWTENQPADGMEVRICSLDNLHKETRTVMVSVQGGSFQLGKALGTVTGSDNPDSTPVSNVTVSSFYIGKYQVTQAQWQAVMGSLPNSLPVGTNYGRGDAFPVYYVNWYSALVFCNKLSVMEGLTPAYRISDSTNPDDWGTVPTSGSPNTNIASWNAVTIDSGSTGYRLPTEAQWEYAAKGGNTGETFTYAGSDTVDDVAWHDSNSGNTSHAVGTKAPNGLGLYDMSGNIYEWCWDWYGNYTNTDKTDPTGTSSGTYRVARGGCWSEIAEHSRSAYRELGPMLSAGRDMGLRVLRPAQ